MKKKKNYLNLKESTKKNYQKKGLSIRQTLMQQYQKDEKIWAEPNNNPRSSSLDLIYVYLLQTISHVEGQKRLKKKLCTFAIFFLRKFLSKYLYSSIIKINFRANLDPICKLLDQVNLGFKFNHFYFSRNKNYKDAFVWLARIF